MMNEKSKVDKSILKVDWCSHQAAKYACEHWYYTHTAPAGKLVKIGAWERGQFVGVVLFGSGANNNLGKPYGLKMTECCELVRVAFKCHETSLSRIVSIALRMLTMQSPGLRLILSYADSTVHHGGIYQAMNWLFVGDTQGDDEYIYHGERMHGRSVRARWGTRVGIPDLQIVKGPVKHRYAYPLDEQMREQVQSLAKPFPKKSRLESVAGDTLLSQQENEPFESASTALCVRSIGSDALTVPGERGQGSTDPNAFPSSCSADSVSPLPVHQTIPVVPVTPQKEGD